MSFEAFLQCFDHGEPGGLALSSVRSIFPVIEAESEPGEWMVRWDDDTWCRIGVHALESDPSRIHQLTVYRPVDDERLWEAMLAVMRLGHVVVYFPADAPPGVASDTAAQHLPPDMVATLGAPVVIRSAREIPALFERRDGSN